MARHAQDGSNDLPKYVCLNCQDEQCYRCIDILRVLARRVGIKLCNCKRKGHSDYQD